MSMGTSVSGDVLNDTVLMEEEAILKCSIIITILLEYDLCEIFHNVNLSPWHCRVLYCSYFAIPRKGRESNQ